MKKLLSIFAFLGFIAFAGQVSAQSGNGLGGQAIAAFRQQCNSFQGSVDAQVNVVSACFYQGFITEVLIVRNVNCQQVDCNAIRYAPLAKVTFGCDNEVISVECYNNY